MDDLAWMERASQPAPPPRAPQQVALVLTGLVVLVYVGFTWALTRMVRNESPSLPLGFYWRLNDGLVLQRGDLVELSLPDAWVPVVPPAALVLLKRVAGLTGDVVCWTAETMTVNGAVVAGRSPVSPVQQVAPGCRRLTPQEIVVLGAHPQSADSRDMGPVARARVRARVVPLVTWKGTR